MSDRLKTIIFFFALFLLFFFLQYSPDSFGDPDGYFHVKTAQLLVQNGPIDTFPWITETTWAVNFSDHYLLYHLLLYPFTLLHPLVGAQLLNALLGTGIFFVFYLTLKHFKIRYPLLWTFLLLVGSQSYLTRLLLIKAVPMGMLWLMSAVLALLKKNLPLLVLSSFLITLSYGGFVFLPIILVIYIFSVWFVERRIDYKLPLASLLAMALAILIHPGRDNLIPQLYTHIFQAGLLYRVGVGSEWASPTPLKFISGNVIIFLPWLASWVLFFYERKLKPLRADLVFLLASSSFFFLLMIKSIRFTEYWTPLAGLTTLAIFAYYFSFDKIKTWFDGIRRQPLQSLPLYIGAGALILVLAFTVFRTATMIKDGAKISAYEPAAQFLQDFSSKDDIVFNMRWDHFPMLFFLNSDNRYVTGLDPMFMYGRDSEKFWLWYHISLDEEKTCEERICGDSARSDLENVITDDFDARFVFLENEDSPNLKNYLEQNTEAQKLYTDNFSTVFEIVK